MSPIPALNSSLTSILPNAALLQPETQSLSTTGIQMPLELGELSPAPSASNSFASMLGQMVSEVNNQQASAAQAVGALQSGKSIPLHHAVIAMEEANVSFQLMVEVRNRLLDSYQEIMRMQV
jgi:flagellar hook-basal body complex protein FliE